MYKSTLCICLAVALAGCNKEETKNLETAAKNAAEQAGNAVADGFAAAKEKATEAVKNVEGGPDLLKNIGDSFASAEQSLAGIKDSEMARAAGPALDDVSTKIQGLAAAAEKFPAEAKTALAPMIEAGVAKLKELYEKDKAIPEVEAVVKPKLDAIVAKISSLVGTKG